MCSCAAGEDCSVGPKHTDLYKCPTIMLACYYCKHSRWTRYYYTHTNRGSGAASAAHRHWFPLKSSRSSGHLWPLDIHNIYLVADMGERPYCRAAAVTHAAGVQFGRAAALFAVYTAHPFSRAPQGSPLWDVLFICPRQLRLHPLARLTASISPIPALAKPLSPSARLRTLARFYVGATGCPL